MKLCCEQTADLPQLKAAQPSLGDPESHHPPGAKGAGFCCESHWNNLEQEQGQAELLLRAKGMYQPTRTGTKWFLSVQAGSQGQARFASAGTRPHIPPPRCCGAALQHSQHFFHSEACSSPLPQPLLFEQSQDKQIFVCTSCINVRSALGTALSVDLWSQDERGAPGAGWEPVSPSQTRGSGLSSLQPWQRQSSCFTGRDCQSCGTQC